MADDNNDVRSQLPSSGGSPSASGSNAPERPGMASGSTGGLSETASAMKASAIDSVKQNSSRIAGEAKQYAGDMANRAKDKGRSVFSEKKDSAIGQMDTVAQALRTTAQQIQEGGQPQVARYIGMAADQVESIGGRLREKDLDTLIDDAQNMARRSPGVFLAGTVVAGFLIARFLKSSADRRRESGMMDDASTTGSYDLPVAYTPSSGAGSPVGEDIANNPVGNDTNSLTSAYPAAGATGSIETGAAGGKTTTTPSASGRSNLGDNFYGNR